MILAKDRLPCLTTAAPRVASKLRKSSLGLPIDPPVPWPASTKPATSRSPVPPSSKSFPPPPTRKSLPPAPLRLSLSSPPYSKSRPTPPLSVSLPEPPSKTSPLSLALSTSLPFRPATKLGAIPFAFKASPACVPSSKGIRYRSSAPVACNSIASMPLAIVLLAEALLNAATSNCPASSTSMRYCDKVSEVTVTSAMAGPARRA